MIIMGAILSDFRSLKDKTFKVQFETNELTPEQLMGIGQNVQQFGYLAFKREMFSANEKKVLDDLKTDFEDGRKTPAQRLRGVFFRMFEKDNEGYKDFFTYYNAKMEQVISHFKTKLD